MDEQREIQPDFADKYQAAQIHTVEGDIHSYRNTEAEEPKETGELEIHLFGRGGVATRRTMTALHSKISPSVIALMLATAQFWFCFTCLAGSANFFASYNYLEKRKNFETLLLRKEPAPQHYTNDPPPEGVQKVTYTSDGRELFGWLIPGKNSATPVVVYVHGGFAFGGVRALPDAAPFIKAGFTVFFPTFRGENGNPGHFEHMYGEVDDAAASIRWLANQPAINPARIYAFGHSLGGGIAALLALRNDTPLRMTASSGGLYPPNVFASWRKFTPFDYGERTETELRLMMHHADELRITHIGYLGTNDSLADAFVEAYGDPPLEQAPKLQIEWVVGDHFEALRPSAERFIARIMMDE